MNENHPEKTSSAGLFQQWVESRKLTNPEAAYGQKWQGGPGGRKPDQGHMPSHSQSGEKTSAVWRNTLRLPLGIASHVRGQAAERVQPANRNVGVMIAGYDCHFCRRPEPTEHPFGFHILPGKPRVGQIAGNHDVIRRRLFEVGDERLQDIGPMLCETVDPPPEICVDSFIQEVPGPGSIQ